MRLKDLPDTTRVQGVGMPDCLEGDNGKAVLVIHGFTGLTDDMRYLAERLNQAGYTVSLPRLPGHGTNHIDFQLTGRRDWLRRCIDSYLELRSRFDTVYVTGLSMGGLLTIILASLFPVPRIALAAPAIINTNKKIYLTPLLRFFIGRVRSPYDEEPEDPQREYIASEYWRWRYAAQIYELLRLQRQARRALRTVEADTLTIVSKGDASVPLTAADIIENNIAAVKKRRLILEKSPHVLVNDVEKEQVAAEIIDWFSD
ncbi:MAG: alpha/beta hydrolase [Sediminispirochaetaceae bacterium]